MEGANFAERESNQSLILDATSSFRHMWLNKNNPNTVFMDVRGNAQLRQDWRARSDQEHRNRPDLEFNRLTLQADFTHLPFKDESFYHINFDPPQLIHLGKTSIYFKLYGALEADTWRLTLKQAARELWRVLKVNGTLNVKWNDRDIKTEDVLKLFPEQPLYGQQSSHGATSNTHWFSFMKFSSNGDKTSEVSK